MTKHPNSGKGCAMPLPCPVRHNCSTDQRGAIGRGAVSQAPSQSARYRRPLADRCSHGGDARPARGQAWIDAHVKAIVGTAKGCGYPKETQGMKEACESLASTQSDDGANALQTAMGPVIGALLRDPDVVEVMLNPDGALWVDRLSTGHVPLATRMSAEEGERIIRAVATHLDVKVNRAQPLLSAVLPGTGDRFDGALPPVAAGPVFALRKRVAGVIPLESYVEDGLMTSAQANYLRCAVRHRQNILIAGGSGTGKTTLASSLLAEMAQTGEGVLVLEDAAELQCVAPNHVPVRTASGDANMTALIAAAVRLRPDRVVLGEIRGGEVLAILKLWYASCPGGIATLHATSPLNALLRLEQLMPQEGAQLQESSDSSESRHSPELENRADSLRALIAQTINVVIYMAGRGKRRRVDRIECLTGHDGEGYRLVDAVTHGLPSNLPFPRVAGERHDRR